MGRSDDVTLPLGTPFLTDPAAAAVVRAVSAGGHEVFFVGGCVRNALMGTGATDIDLASDAEPAQVIALAEAAGLRTVPPGLARGTVAVLAEGQPIEVTFVPHLAPMSRGIHATLFAALTDDACNLDLQTHFEQMPKYKTVLTSKAKAFQKLARYSQESVDIEPLEEKLSNIYQRFIVSV